MVEAAAPLAGAAAVEEFACPKCGTPREDLGIPFCEACGYNFATRTGGAERVIPAAAPLEAPEIAAEAAEPAPATRWALTLSVDPALREPGSPEPPADFAPFTFTLDEAVSLIGRRSVARAIEPEIPLTHDDAVSHRHALLQLDENHGLQLRDIGSSNGTRLNGTEVKAMVDYPLKDGDEITLGHWSRISVKAVQ
jgi:rubredoxin